MYTVVSLSQQTVSEKPIGLTPDPTTPVKANNPSIPHPVSPSSSENARRGLSRATSIITNHVMDISLSPIHEESASSSQEPVPSDSDTSQEPVPSTNGTLQEPLPPFKADTCNRFAFPSNGHLRCDESPPVTMAVPVTTVTPIIVTDLEDDVSHNEQGSEEVRGDFTDGGDAKEETQLHVTEGEPKRTRSSRKISTIQRPSPRLYIKRHSVHELGRPGLSPFSRQSSWNEYKGHSPPIRRRHGWEVNRYPSSPSPDTIFDGSLEEVAKLLRKMAEAIENDMVS